MMIVVSETGKVRRVDFISFDEPQDYLPGRRWMKQFDGRPLDGELSPGKGIHVVTGATLSSRAITAAVRRSLALHQMLVASFQEEVP